MDLDTSAIEYDTHWQRFVNWSIDRTTAQIKKLKTPSSMKAHLYKLDERLVLLYDTKVIAHFKDMIQARDKINKVKNNVTQELQYASPVCALFEGVYCGHEGYVVTSPSGDMMKIVNRREFSARNFNKNKGGSFENNSR